MYAPVISYEVEVFLGSIYTLVKIEIASRFVNMFVLSFLESIGWVNGDTLFPIPNSFSFTGQNIAKLPAGNWTSNHVGFVIEVRWKQICKKNDIIGKRNNYSREKEINNFQWVLLEVDSSLGIYI